MNDNKEILSNKSKSEQEITEYEPTDELFQLSIHEVFVVFLLSTFKMPIQRYTLLQDVNDIIFKNKNISTSSFYHTIEKLNKMGLIDYTNVDDKKFVKGTEQGKKALEKISRISCLFSVDFKKLLEGFKNKFDSNSGKIIYKTGLMISFEDFFDIGRINDRMESYEIKNIISDDLNYDKMIKRGLDQDIHKSVIRNKKIREPDGFYEQVIITDYKELEEKFFGLTNQELLKEVYRVLKEEGTLFIQYHNAIANSHDFAVEQLAESFKKSPFYNEISNEVVKNDFLEALQIEPSIIGYKEFNVAIIKKM